MLVFRILSTRMLKYNTHISLCLPLSASVSRAPRRSSLATSLVTFVPSQLPRIESRPLSLASTSGSAAKRPPKYGQPYSYHPVSLQKPPHPYRRRGTNANDSQVSRSQFSPGILGRREDLIPCLERVHSVFIRVRTTSLASSDQMQRLDQKMRLAGLSNPW